MTTNTNHSAKGQIGFGQAKEIEELLAQREPLRKVECETEAQIINVKQITTFIKVGNEIKDTTLRYFMEKIGGEIVELVEA